MLHFSYIQFSSFFRGLSGNILIIVICPVFDGKKKTVRKPNHAVHMCWWVPATRVSHPAACRCGKWWAGLAEDRDGLESAREKEGTGRLQALIHMGWNTVFFFFLKRGGITQQCSKSPLTASKLISERKGLRSQRRRCKRPCRLDKYGPLDWSVFAFQIKALNIWQRRRVCRHRSPSGLGTVN